MHLDCKVQITALIADKAFVHVPIKYLNFPNIFFKESAMVLPEHTKINTYVIDLKKDK